MMVIGLEGQSLSCAHAEPSTSRKARTQPRVSRANSDFLTTGISFVHCFIETHRIRDIPPPRHVYALADGNIRHANAAHAVALPFRKSICLYRFAMILLGRLSVEAKRRCPIG